MKFDIPEPLQIAESELKAHLGAATEAGGKTAEEARVLQAVLLPHFLKERDDELNPLSLLGPLSEGRVSPAMADVLPAIERLRAELPALEKEHEEVFAALHRLVDAAKAEGKPEVARFAKRLILRAWIDEAVFYPATLLVGEHLKFKLNKAEDA
jgi:hypothetical protein